MHDGSQAGVDAVKGAAGPEACEHGVGQEIPQHDAQNTITCRGHVGRWSIALQIGQIKGDADLKSGIGDALVARLDPCGKQRNHENQTEKRSDVIEVRDHEDDGGDPDRAADQCADNAECELGDHLTHCRLGDDEAGDDAGMDALPVQDAENEIAEHDRCRAFDGKAGMVRIGEGVRCEKAAL